MLIFLFTFFIRTAENHQKKPLILIDSQLPNQFSLNNESFYNDIKKNYITFSNNIQGVKITKTDTHNYLKIQNRDVQYFMIDEYYKHQSIDLNFEIFQFENDKRSVVFKFNRKIYNDVINNNTIIIRTRSGDYIIIYFGEYNIYGKRVINITYHKKSFFYFNCNIL